MNVLTVVNITKYVSYKHTFIDSPPSSALLGIDHVIGDLKKRSTFFVVFYDVMTLLQPNYLSYFYGPFSVKPSNQLPTQASLQNVLSKYGPQCVKLVFVNTAKDQHDVITKVLYSYLSYMSVGNLTFTPKFCRDDMNQLLLSLQAHYVE